MCSQLAYTYASHRRTRTPFTSLLFTSLNGRSRKHLDGTNDGSYRRWRNTEWWDEDIDGLWNPPPASTTENQEPQAASEAAVTEDAPETLVQQAPIKLEAPSEPTNGEAATELAPVPTSDTHTAAPSSRLKNRRARKAEPPRARSSCSQESVVYLTADAEEELMELKEGETYVIGGIVDRNRYKASSDSCTSP